MMSERQSALLFAESKRSVERNRVVLAESRRRAAASRRLLNPWFAVSGGSEASDRALRATVRSLLASGLLRPIDGKALSGQGTWKRCVVCGDPITPTEVHVQPDGSHAVDSFVHVRCFLAWYDVSSAADGKAPPEEARGTESPA